MSPYVVTTTRSCTCQPSECESDGLLYHEIGCGVFNTPRADRVSRRAVATLEEAHEAAYEASRGPGSVNAIAQAVRDVYALPESGGTVTLPDGTVIEVEQMTA